MENISKIIIKFRGNNINPSVVESNDLADILHSISTLLGGYIDNNFKDENRKNHLSLTSITDSCVALEFESNQEDHICDFVEFLNRKTKDNVIEFNKSAEPIQKFVSFNKKYKCNALIAAQYNQNIVEFKIDQELKIAKPLPLLENTTMFGTLVRVGGKEPRIRLDVPNFEVITCEVTEEQAKILGSKLYTTVSLTGLAKWMSFEDRILDYFKVETINGYSSEDPVDVLNDLRSSYGNRFQDIESPVDWVNNFRETEDEQ